MDPLKPYSFNHANAVINTVSYHYIDQRPSKPSSKPPVVLVHGFPDVIPPTLCLSNVIDLVRLAISNPRSRQSRSPSHRALPSRLL
jgi:hypothetical protein